MSYRPKFNEDCNLLFLGNKNGIAGLFDASSGEGGIFIPSLLCEILEIAMSIDGTRFATASNLGTIKVWKLGNIEPIMEIGEVNHASKINITKIHFTLMMEKHVGSYSRWINKSNNC